LSQDVRILRRRPPKGVSGEILKLSPGDRCRRSPTRPPPHWMKGGVGDLRLPVDCGGFMRHVTLRYGPFWSSRVRGNDHAACPPQRGRPAGGRHLTAPPPSPPALRPSASLPLPPTVFIAPLACPLSLCRFLRGISSKHCIFILHVLSSPTCCSPPPPAPSIRVPLPCQSPAFPF